MVGAVRLFCFLICGTLLRPLSRSDPSTDFCLLISCRPLIPGGTPFSVRICCCLNACNHLAICHGILIVSALLLSVIFHATKIIILGGMLPKGPRCIGLVDLAMTVLKMPELPQKGWRRSSNGPQGVEA